MPDGEDGASFGQFVAVEDRYVVIGAPDAGEGRGEAYVFPLDGARLAEPVLLSASDGAPSDSFGAAVAVSNGTVMVVAVGVDDDTGAVYVFERDAGGWQETAKLHASDRAAGDYFGTVALDGTTMLVAISGAVRRAGGVYYFDRNGQWSERQNLMQEENVGFAPSISVQQNTAFIHSTLGVWYYELDAGQWIASQEVDPVWRSPDLKAGWGVSHDGKVAVVGEDWQPGPLGQGWVHVLVEEGGRWAHRQGISAPVARPELRFGWKALLKDKRMVVTSAGEYDNDFWAVDAFREQSGEWVFDGEVPQPGGPAPVLFGRGLALRDDLLIVGAPLAEDSAGRRSGVVYVYEYR